jgi:iron(III) transport system substrate-binding protein
MQDPGWKRCLALMAASAVLAVACSGAGASTSPAAQSQAPVATSQPSTAPTAAASTAASTAPSQAAASPSPDAAAARSTICEAAKAEGKLVYWNNFAKPDVIFAAFNKAYPGIVVDPLTSRPDDFAQALLTEIAAGRKPTADIMYGELNVLKPIFDVHGEDATIDWKALGARDEILTPTGNVVRIQRVAGGIVYNTSAVKPEDLPSTWGGLLDQKWSGQLVVDARGRPFDQLSLLWGHDQAIGYIKQLLALKPIVINGGTAGMLAVAGGQAKVTTGGRSESTAEEKSKGTPIEIKYLDVIPTLDAFNLVPKGAPHPNAAACMVAWLATDGAAAFEAAEFKTNLTRPTGAPEDAALVEVDTAEKADAVKKIGKEIGALYTGTGG